MNGSAQDTDILRSATRAAADLAGGIDDATLSILPVLALWQATAWALMWLAFVILHCRSAAALRGIFIATFIAALWLLPVDLAPDRKSARLLLILICLGILVAAPKAISFYLHRSGTIQYRCAIGLYCFNTLLIALNCLLT